MAEPTTSNPPSTSPTVIIVGLGIAGLTAAIECQRRGFTVIGLEKKPDSKQLGDLIGLSGNGVQVIARWSHGAVAHALRATRSNNSSFEIYDIAGDLKGAAPYDPDDPAQGFVIRRNALVEALLQEARRLGVDLRYNVSIQQYWETDREAGVVTVSRRGGNGEEAQEEREEKLVADAVIAADGVHSTAREFVLHGAGADNGSQNDSATIKLRKSGGGIFRSHFDARLCAEDEKARWVLEGTEQNDRFRGYMGKEVGIVMGTTGNGEFVFWTCFHRDTPDSKAESWVQICSVDPVLEYIKDWPIGEQLSAVISRTPQGNCFNHLLLTSDPLPTWVSNKSRVMIIGDAAHPTLPHAGQGANQAIEDAAVVAISLELAGKKGDIPLGLKVAEKIRHKRATLIQEGSIVAQEISLKGGFDADNQEDSASTIPRQAWIYLHDCVEYTYKEFERAAAAVRDVTLVYVPTNVPEDGKYRYVDDFAADKEKK
ncbi:FAD binding domain protein [Aspergillus homomorphus CBS 101889]|uniref:FAD binding domain protein n=1 Tax=Aspergillus homomorphus (strain CBS 101889) TaxID=1450537 RepID=A0A395HMU8_ASPHC|nr:FAD binding domain protein [Aspergillus homomorphus CBS 101889]RAL08585.1 FAD binding domain protein [Aspergillus homomorphus CBS 101889]